MNKYELTLILDGKVGSAKVKKVSEDLTKILKIFKGVIKESREWGVKELAYKIGRSETGFYLYFELEMDSSGVKALNDKLRANPDVIRYLVVRK